MNKLDTSNWKYFFLGDKRHFKVRLVKKRIILSDYKFSWTKTCDSVPVVSSSEFTNGVMGFVGKNDKDDLYSSNAITISGYGSVGACFFQPFDFYANNSILTVHLTKKNINHLLAFFLCSIIGLEKFRYSFGRALNLENLLKVKILLPQDEKGEPDWLWMENYSKKIFSQVKEDIIKLIDIERERERETKISLDIDNWKEFPISDYFHTSSIRTTKKEDILPGKFFHITGRSDFNGYEGTSDKWAEKGKVITIGVYGSAFYQEKNFITSSYHLEKIWPKNKELNKHNALFLTTILNFGASKYSYGRMRSLENIRKEKIILPSEQSDFDWEYMENMIKKKWEEIATKFKKELEKIN